MDPIIRYAEKEDVPSILFLIKELAEFENCLSSVQATEQSLLSTLSFPTKPPPSKPGVVDFANFTPGFSRTLLLILPTIPKTDLPHETHASDGVVVGMALYFTNYSTWRGAPGIYLEDLYVRREFRRQGFAKLLLRTLARESLRLGGKRLEWACLKWNEGALKFYKSIGAKQMDEWIGLRVDEEALDKLAE